MLKAALNDGVNRRPNALPTAHNILRTECASLARIVFGGLPASAFKAPHCIAAAVRHLL
jgi:hypothetical protein